MNEKLLAALDHISDAHLTEALRQKRKKYFVLKAAAAILALVLLMSLPPLTMPVAAQQVVSPAEYEPLTLPDFDDYADPADYRAAWDACMNARDTQNRSAESANHALKDFYASTLQTFLTGEENAVLSPVNTALSLSMLAQMAGGSTRQELLDLLGFDSVETLQTGFRAVWEQVVFDNAYEQRSLANSIWLDKSLSYHQENLDILGTQFYASVYKTDLSRPSAQRAIDTWITNNTGGLLGSDTPKSTLSPADDPRVMTLLSTAHLNARWGEPFNPDLNTEATFHTPDGDVTATFMNKRLAHMSYSWGEHYGAVALHSEEGCILWLVLPDEGKTVSDVLQSGDYLHTVLASPWLSDDRRGEYLVNLSMPKFDVGSNLDLKAGLESLGIEAIFGLSADFSSTFPDSPVYVDSIQQSARITVDERGIQAASVIRIEGAGAAPSPDQIVDFTLDRPFLFVLTVRNIPLFAGVVNEP